MTESWIVCGWYTPDYRLWWQQLRWQLEALAVPHDFVERPKGPGGWEANTLRKPAEVLAAIDRHPGKTIIFLDVDCSVSGKAGLARLAQITGDVAFYVRTKWRRSGGHRLGPRSGTLVLRPTPAARAFVTAWLAESRQAPRWAVDQTALAVALGRCPGVAIEFLDVSYCAVPADRCPDPVILHDSASRDQPKAGRLQRWINRLAGPRVPVAA